MATILVVDDELSIRRVLRATLEGAGHTVLEASDGPQALLEAAQRHPDLVLLDVALPGLAGPEVCRRLRALPDTIRTPVLFLTGVLPSGRPEELAQAGASGWLQKPFPPAHLLEQVRAALAA